MSKASLFKVGTSLTGKNFAPGGSEFFPLREVPYGMEHYVTFPLYEWTASNLKVATKQNHDHAKHNLKYPI